MNKVIFDKLPKEPFFQKVFRILMKRTRKNQFVHLSMNGRKVICGRGIPVELSDEHFELAKAVKGSMYNFKEI